MIITIDGPTASGKSSLGLRLAKHLGYYYIYSGLLYRALAYLLVHNTGYKIENLESPKKVHINTFLAYPERFVYEYDNDGREHIVFDGIDITPHLKNSFIDTAASVVSKCPIVRQEIDKLQKKLAKEFDVVVDGRDAGSVVFPHADYQFYITAAPQERAKRWRTVQKKYGFDYSLSEALEKINERDARDKGRSIAPLVIPPYAIKIDNTHLTIDQTTQKILTVIET